MHYVDFLILYNGYYIYTVCVYTKYINRYIMHMYVGWWRLVEQCMRLAPSTL